MRRSAVAVVLLGVVACQPVDDVAPDPEPTVEQVTETPLDAPVRGMPSTLAELLARAEPPARRWQDEPVVAEILVDVGPDGRWARAQVTYVAADADRLLIVTVTADGVSEELTTLAALQLEPVTARGMRDVPPPPGDALGPAELARRARPALRECGTREPPTGVLYASGAPSSWNGRRWSTPPGWTATVTTEGAAVQLDPVTAEPLGCVVS